MKTLTAERRPTPAAGRPATARRKYPDRTYLACAIGGFIQGIATGNPLAAVVGPICGRIGCIPLGQGDR